MKKLIRELRRREVFRTAGLYVGICWILIEVASVILPTFDAPESSLRYLIIAAFVGFPVMLVLAWVYDLTERGIEVQADLTDTVVAPIGSRKGDFVVIGVLSVALILSVYLNVTGGPAEVRESGPVSILIADFRNETGNPLFDGLIEQALNVGIESAPHITSYQRPAAREMAFRLQPDSTVFDTSLASLIAVREGIKLVLAGSIQVSGSGFELEVEGVDPADFTTVFRIDRKAGSADVVLQVVGDLSREIREQLGDSTLDKSVSPIAETFTAASLEAAKAYTTAIQLAYEGRHDEAVERFRRAAELDPNFGRAFSGWALSEFKLGRTEAATELWKKALSLMETMTERERLRTLGLYYASVSGNFENAVQSFGELVAKYPADAAGQNNFAVAAFLTQDFDTATEAGRRLLEIYPNSQLYRSNFALYAMYSGDFDAAAQVARELIADHPEYGTSYLPLAIAELAAGAYDAAADAYRRMAEAEASEHRASLATLGLADIAIYTGRFDEADRLLREGIQADVDMTNQRAAAVKTVALAQSHAAAGQMSQAIDAAEQALQMSNADAVSVSAALVLLEAGEVAAAADIGARLSGKLQSQGRAFGLMLQGAIARHEGRFAESVELLRRAVGLADLWLIRFELGRTYLDAEFFAEAVSEFIACDERRGEASAAFLDDMPTWRFLAPLPYWTARAQDALGMQTSANQGYETFLSLRPSGGTLAGDARQRIE